jgi:HK97 gp10 family phage protein
MSGLRVQIKGIPAIKARLGGARAAGVVPKALEKGGVIVEGAATDNVHKVTRKLAQSIGVDVQGRGWDAEAHVGPQPGLGQPRGYSESDTSRWQKPRAGTNRGDPQEYAIFEEEGTRYRPAHPFLEPALTENEDRVVETVMNEIKRQLGLR